MRDAGTTGLPWLYGVAWLCSVVLLVGSAAADPGSLDALGSSDPGAVARVVEQIERDTHADPDVLLAAARAVETKLFDPGHAIALYARIVEHAPDSRAAAPASRRLAALRELVGDHAEHAREATELARLIAEADHRPADDVRRAARRLSERDWPGAATAGLWLADWLRSAGQLSDAQDQYARVAVKWPNLAQGRAALSNGASCALDAHDWDLAEALARQLPAFEPGDLGVRDDVLMAAARGRQRARWYVAAWLAIAGALVALLASLAEAALRHGPRRPSLRPPIEIVFLAPVAVVLIAVALTAHRAIAPAVTMIASGGLALAWLSGATLELLRVRGRPVGLRGIAHAIACSCAVIGLGYLALVHGGLLDMLIETVQFGPDS